MFPFLSPHELNLIRRDYADVVRAPESNLITLKYKTYFAPADQPAIDDVYKDDTRLLTQVDSELPNVNCIMQVVHARNLKLLAFGMLNVGDVLFYFLDDINFLEPIQGQKVVPGTLAFLDATGITWEPILDAGPMSHYLKMLVQDIGSAQVMAAQLKK